MSDTLTLNDLAFAVENETACTERPSVIRSLKETARDFLIQSEGWIIEAAPSIDPSVTQYNVVGNLSAFVIRIIQVRFLYNNDEYTLPEIRYRMADNKNIAIDSEYLKDNASLKIFAAVAPNPGSESIIPEKFLTRYFDGIRYGACSKIFRQKERPWFDPNMSEYYRNCYLDELSRAIADTRNNLQTGNPGFAG